MKLPEACIHCNLAIPQGDRVVDRIDGEELHFCCQGCRGAYAIITGAGLDSFYEKRTWENPGIPEGAFETIYNDEYLESFTTDRDDGREISFIVSGIRCAACIWLIESILSKIKGIGEATVNYGTHRGRVRFDPLQTSPASIFKAITRLGYVPKPFTLDEARSMQEQESRSLLIRFVTAAFLSMQLMGYSIALYGGYFSGMEQEARQLIQYFSALVATPVVFFSGAPFIKGGWRSVCNMSPDMDLLIALGVLTAYFYSLGALFFGGEIYFETSAMIITLILLGRIFENGARRKALSGVENLLRLSPDTAHLVQEGKTISVPSSKLQVGDIILVQPGERFPVDGVLMNLETEVDESVLTGEADPVLRKSGDRVLSGALNISTAIRVKVVKTAGTSFMACIARMVEDAQNRKAPVQGLADQVAGVFVPIVIMIALATGVFWFFSLQDSVAPLLYAVSVLVVACPCALGLATPTAILVASGVAAEKGILFRGGDTLESAARLTVAAFDKTGTLTEGDPHVIKLVPFQGDEKGLLALAAKVEAGSNHPIALGILRQASQAGIYFSGEGGKIIPGKGVSLVTEEGLLVAGSRDFMETTKVDMPKIESTVFTEVHVALAGKYQGCILLDNRLRIEAPEVIRRINNLGLKTYLLTGDHKYSAERVSREVGINQYGFNMSPQDKIVWVGEMSDKGETVLMVGDGVNDAPALSEATVGCAMGSGTDIALETSDLVLIHNNLEQLPAAIELARQTLRIIRQNLFWAFTYNLVALPLAATGKLAPVYAAAAMATSSILVVANSLRIKGALKNSG